MDLSVGLPSFATDGHRIPASRFEGYAREAEACGFAGGYVIEHLAESPNYATSLLDSLTTLATVGGATESLPLGTSILILPMRDPVLVAKRAATIQHLCDRRLTLGVATGYVESEYETVGVPFEERSPRFLEGIEILHRLLNEETVTFEGEFYSVEEFRLEPKPSMPPRVLTGGGGLDVDGERRVLKSVQRRIDHADGWIASPRDTGVLENDWSYFEGRLEETGRDPEDVDRVGLQYVHLVPIDDPELARAKQRKAFGRMLGTARTVEEATGSWLSGTVPEIHETLTIYEEMGFDEVILHPVTNTPGELHRQLSLWRDHLLSEFS
jgi:alkanesulfonate monooxygenase